MSLKQIALGFDQLANAILGGYADEALSARAWRRRDDRGWKQFRAFIDVIFFWQEAHCAAAFQSEMDRKQLPYSYTRNPPTPR